MDMMVVEATWLRNLLGLPERDTWDDTKEESQTSDAGKTQRLSCIEMKILDSCCLLLCCYITDMADNKDETSEKTEGSKEKRSGARSRIKDVGKRLSAEKSVEVRGNDVLC